MSLCDLCEKLRRFAMLWRVLIGHTVSCNAIQSTGTCPLGWQIAQIGQKKNHPIVEVKMGQDGSRWVKSFQLYVIQSPVTL